MKKKIFILMILLIVLVIGLVTAEILIMNLSVSKGNKEVLERKGIGEIEKVREICNETICFNETYIDVLQLQEQGCNNGYCYFKLYEDGGIDKPFKIELESICNEMGTCIEFEEEYECCLSWRGETNEEIMIKANAKSEEILNRIAYVTLDRESRGRVKRFDDINVSIGEK